VRLLTREIDLLHNPTRVDNYISPPSRILFVPIPAVALHGTDVSSPKPYEIENYHCEILDTIELNMLF
jgi:hypothetical protein